MSNPFTITSCPECGSENLEWSSCLVNNGSADDGRLRMHELECKFMLGCIDCSETIKTVNSETVAGFLNATQGFVNPLNTD